MISNVAQAADLISRYGNVIDKPDGLLKVKPTASQLAEAARRCHEQVDYAVTLICQHHDMEIEG